MNKRTDLLSNMKSMVDTRDLSSAAVLTLDTQDEHNQACLSSAFVCRDFVEKKSNYGRTENGVKLRRVQSF